MDIGKNLYELRKKNAITQETLAFEMGVSVAAVSKWENDKALPDMNGLDILKEIQREYPEIKVAMLTADDTEKSKNITISNGADMYITKPFLPEHIQMALKELTGKV